MYRMNKREVREYKKELIRRKRAQRSALKSCKEQNALGSVGNAPALSTDAENIN